MKGGGVGFSVTKDNIAKLPPVASAVDLTIVIDRRSASYEASLKMGAVDRQAWEQAHATERNDRYVLPDTREGWVLANAKVIDHHLPQLILVAKRNWY